MSASPPSRPRWEGSFSTDLRKDLRVAYPRAEPRPTTDHAMDPDLDQCLVAGAARTLSCCSAKGANLSRRRRLHLCSLARLSCASHRRERLQGHPLHDRQIDRAWGGAIYPRGGSRSNVCKSSGSMEGLLVHGEDRHLRRAEQARIVERPDFQDSTAAGPGRSVVRWVPHSGANSRVQTARSISLRELLRRAFCVSSQRAASADMLAIPPLIFGIRGSGIAPSTIGLAFGPRNALAAIESQKIRPPFHGALSPISSRFQFDASARPTPPPATSAAKLG